MEVVSDWGETFSADKAEGSVLVLFIPSVDRQGIPIQQEEWERRALELLGRLFGGATAFPQGRGVWRDDEAGGRLIFDAPVIVQCYTSVEMIEEEADQLRSFLVEMGRATRQGAVGFVIDRQYLEIKMDAESE